MNYGMYLSAAALRIGQVRMDVIANNLANVNTTSFKRDMTVVGSRPSAPEAANLPPHMAVPVLDSLAGGLLPDGVFTDFTQGKLITTDNELDVAIQGEGFFSVLAEGEVRFTRDGRFDRANDGALVTAAEGFAVLDDAGKPIQLPPGKATIDSLGAVTVGGFRAQLGLTEFAERNSLRKAGKNTYTAAEGAQTTPATATIRQYCIEGSGVDPTRTLVDMIVAQRTYEASAKMIEYSDSMLGRAVNDIARIA